MALLVGFPVPKQETLELAVKVTNVLGRMMVHYSKEVWNRWYYGTDEDRAEIIPMIWEGFKTYFALPDSGLLSLPLEEIEVKLDEYLSSPAGNRLLSGIPQVFEQLQLECHGSGGNTLVGNGNGS